MSAHGRGATFEKWGPLAPAEILASIILFLCVFLCVAECILLWWRGRARDSLHTYLRAFEARRDARRRAAYATELVHLKREEEGMREGLTSGDEGVERTPPWGRPSLSDDEDDDRKQDHEDDYEEGCGDV